MSYRLKSRQQVDNADCDTLQKFSEFAPAFTQQVRIEEAQRINPNTETIDVKQAAANGLPYSISYVDGEPYMVNTATLAKDPDTDMFFASLYFWMIEKEKDESV